MKKEIKITYFFQGGRSLRLGREEIFAKEMFYGYDYFKKRYPDTKIIEFSNHKTKLRRLFFLVIEKQLRKILKLPLYWTFIISKKNYQRIKISDYLVLSNNRMACSALPMIKIAKRKNKKLQSLCFVMGLFSRNPKFKIFNRFQRFYINSLLKNIEHFIFLSDSEMKKAIEKFPTFEEKFITRPFAVDQEVWNKETNKKDDYVLFVGNDGFRDYELAENLTLLMPEVNFIFVSEMIDEKKLQKSNSKLIKGSWGEPGVSDLELRDLYRNAKVTIVPLKNSLQPSGQSVTLQSMSCGTPVIISKTDGFWDNKRITHEENILFVNDNTVENWVSAINGLFALTNDEYNLLIEKGIKLIKNYYQLEKYNLEIEKILFKQ